MQKAYMPQSKTDVHLTPERVKDIVREKWNLEWDDMFDPCPMNHQFNGLDIDWKEWNNVNPPYGKKVTKKIPSLLELFVDKAIHETSKGHKSIMLLPTKTDQDWFHKIIRNGYEIEWIHKRLRFNMKHCCFDTCYNVRRAFSGATQPHFLVMIK